MGEQAKVKTEEKVNAVIRRMKNDVEEEKRIEVS